MGNRYKIANIVFQCSFVTQLMCNMFSSYIVTGTADMPVDFSLEYTIEDLENYRSSHCNLALDQCEKIFSFNKAFKSLMEQNIIIGHASVISFDHKGIVFFGAANSGKSTQVELWNKHYGNRVITISDDRPLILKNNRKLMAWNTPWSIFQNHSDDKPSNTEINAVCLLIQSKSNKALRIDSTQIAKGISAEYPEAIRRKLEDIFSYLFENIACYELYNSAVENKLDLLQKEMKL